MATINRKGIKTVKRTKAKPLLKMDDSSMYYNSPEWKSLRNEYYTSHPLCEECLKRDVVSPGEHVHHKYPFLKGRTEEQRWNNLLNINNLVTLCKDCHYGMHDVMNKKGLFMIDSLTDSEYRQYHGIELEKN